VPVAAEKEAADKAEEDSAPAPAYVSLQMYVDRMQVDQKSIYYLLAPSRAAALASPYYEPFKLRNLEVSPIYLTVTRSPM
jgi:HSP90 family molecular chaperone